MSNYNSLKTTIDANIKQNGRQEITGQILNSVLNQMVTTLGAGYQFAGVATLDPVTDPGTPDAKVFYIANGKGTYTNFGGVEVTEDDVVVLYWDSSWHKVSTGIASNEELSELGQNLNYIAQGGYIQNQDLSKGASAIEAKYPSATGEIAGGVGTDSIVVKVQKGLNVRYTTQIYGAYTSVYVYDKYMNPIKKIQDAPFSLGTYYTTGELPANSCYLVIPTTTAEPYGVDKIEATVVDSVRREYNKDTYTGVYYIQGIYDSCADARTQIPEVFRNDGFVFSYNLGNEKIIEIIRKGDDVVFNPNDNRQFAPVSDLYFMYSYIDRITFTPTGVDSGTFTLAQKMPYGYKVIYKDYQKQYYDNVPATVSLSNSQCLVFQKREGTIITKDKIAITNNDVVLLYPDISYSRLQYLNGFLADKFTYGERKISLTKEKTLCIYYKGRNVITGNNPALQFKFDGNLYIHSDINGVDTDLSFARLVTFVQSLTDGSATYDSTMKVIDIPYWKRLSFNLTTNELFTTSSRYAVADDEIVLIDNRDITGTGESTSLNKSNIQGALTDIYRQKVTDIADNYLYVREPDYYLHEGLETKCNSVASAVSPNSLLFTLTTDMHTEIFRRDMQERDLCYPVINSIHRNGLSPDFHVDLGDIIYQHEALLNKNLGLSNLRASLSSFVDAKHKYFTVGNHDYNSMPGETPKSSYFFTDKELYNSFGHIIDKNDVQWGSRDKLYYYKDIEDKKIRMIFLNTTDNVVTFDSAGVMISPDPMNNPTIRQEQIDWFANTALNFMDKGDDRGNWHVIIFCHISFSPMATAVDNNPMPVNGRNTDNSGAAVDNNVLYKLLYAFKTGSSVSYDYVDTEHGGNASVSISKSFAEQGEMNVIGVFSGHTHENLNWDYQGIVFRTFRAGYPHGEQIPLSANGYSASIISIDKENRKINAYMLGYGNDWEATY